MRVPIAIALGAVAGALCRYYLTLWFTQHFGLGFPYGTFFINLTGCLLMGFFITLTLEKTLNVSPELRLMIATGFLGSYTTFSTYSLETITLLKTQSLSITGVYWAGSALLGAIAVQLGASLARWL